MSILKELLKESSGIYLTGVDEDGEYRGTVGPFTSELDADDFIDKFSHYNWEEVETFTPEAFHKAEYE
jgi:hypothetical protein